MSKARAERNTACKLISDLYGHFGSPHKKSNFIFRGEPSTYSSVKCSLLRKMNKVEDNETSIRFSAKEMTRRLASGAAPYVGGDIVGREFETLAAMQHYGAATPLIDFSEDWRVALYFTCERDEDKDGRIIYFTEKRAKKRYDLKIKRPKTHYHDDAGRLAGRQIDQRSVLVWAEDGEFKPWRADALCIPKNLKPHMLAWLRSQGLREDVIYNDLHHYISQINENQKASIAFLLADALFEQCDWRGAIRILKDTLGITKSSYTPITLIEQRGKAYQMLARAYQEQDISRKIDALGCYREAASRLQSKQNGIRVRLHAEDCAKAAGCLQLAAEFRDGINHLW